MASSVGREPIPKVEIGPVIEFVLTDVDVEPLAGGLLRLLFFCEQRPLDTTVGTENVLRARAVTTRELWPVLKQKVDFALACNGSWAG